MTAPFLLENHGPSGIEVVIDRIHTCYRVLDPKKSTDFYVDALGMKVGEMHFSDATNYFFTFAEDTGAPMLKLTHNHDRREPYDPGDSYSHVAFTVDDPEGTVAKLKEQGVKVTLEPKTRPSRATTTA